MSPADHWRTHWPIVLILAAAAFLVLAGLGRDRLWADEGDTAVLAQNILQTGLPTAWDGVTFIDSDAGERLNDRLITIGHPWLQYYVTALSFALFGKSELTARLPFAIAALATIGLIYWLAIRWARDRPAAIASAVLLTVCVQFLLFARQSRYYSLTAFLACLLVLQFMRLRSWGTTLAFAATAVALFHSHPSGLGAIAALCALPFVSAAFRPQRPWVLRAMPIVAALTLPWLAVAAGGYGEGTVLAGSLTVFAARLGQFAIEWASVTPIIGAGLIYVIARRYSETQSGRRRTAARASVSNRTTRGETAAGRRDLVFAVTAVIAGLAFVIAATQTRDFIWMSGVRYAAAVVPLAALLAGLAVSFAARGRWAVWTTLVLVLGLTKFGRLTPWTFWEGPWAHRDREAAVTFHNPENVLDRLLRTSQLAYVRSLLHENLGTTSQIADFLNAHATPRDVVITNYGWEPLYFDTGLPQGSKVAASSPAWAAAKSLGLPPYVFSARGARWIVWRRAWGPYRGIACGRILEQLRRDGVPVTLVATIPETLWENRENVHFRRFAGGRHIFPWFEGLPPAEIYRVG
ncbi:MAG TPA: glycosyltransferase family 39 protein [Vicinamibacterales bacterium]|nr:glycosyltransferase family 39 protein [Vicinamibacterales bacterium]